MGAKFRLRIYNLRLRSGTNLRFLRYQPSDSQVPTIGFTELPTIGFSELPNFGFSELPTYGFTELPTFGFTELPTYGFAQVPTFGFTNNQCASSQLAPVFMSTTRGTRIDTALLILSATNSLSSSTSLWCASNTSSSCTCKIMRERSFLFSIS
jgi:hypothetical protein